MRREPALRGQQYFLMKMSFKGTFKWKHCWSKWAGDEFALIGSTLWLFDVQSDALKAIQDVIMPSEKDAHDVTTGWLIGWLLKENYLPTTADKITNYSLDVSFHCVHSFFPFVLGRFKFLQYLELANRTRYSQTKDVASLFCECKAIAKLSNFLNALKQDKQNLRSAECYYSVFQTT